MVFKYDLWIDVLYREGTDFKNKSLFDNLPDNKDYNQKEFLVLKGIEFQNPVDINHEIRIAGYSLGRVHGVTHILEGEQTNSELGINPAYSDAPNFLEKYVNGSLERENKKIFDSIDLIT